MINKTMKDTIKKFEELKKDMSWMGKFGETVPKEAHYYFYYLNGYINGLLKFKKEDNNN